MYIFKIFHHVKFEKMEITIGFNGNFWLGSLIVIMTNVTETFQDLLKHYFLQTNVARFVKWVLQRITLNQASAFVN